jgi:hypothetical protein
MKYKNYIGLGVAGNFAFHLEQAGEDKDFIGINTPKNAPKGIFPVYLKDNKDFLSHYPFSNNTIEYPKNINDGNLQAEPEVGLLCELIYQNNIVNDIIIKEFTAYNDCSIRRENAHKISHKKNWGSNTKGISSQTIKVDTFQKGGILDNYYIASFLKRDNILHEYGKNSSVLTYSYFYDTLKSWIIDKLNKQEDIGPLENINQHLKNNNYPKNMLISIGATQYSDFGENNFLQNNDELYVIVYDKTKHKYENIKNEINKNNTNITNASVLYQRIK